MHKKYHLSKDLVPKKNIKKSKHYNVKMFSMCNKQAKVYDFLGMLRSSEVKPFTWNHGH